MPIKNKKFDVVVAGGGTAGWAAALASARLGMKTAIIERKGYPGGVLASGLHILGFHDGTGRQVVKGYAHELVERMVGIGASDGYHKTDFWHSSFVAIDSFAIKHVIIDMLKEAGIKMLLFSQAVDVLLEGNKVRGIIVQTKTGRETIQCRVCVDATGDAAIAYAAGAEMQITGDVQPPSLVLRIENVDIGKLREYLLRNPEEFMTYRLKPGCKVTPQFLADTPFFMLSEKKLEKTEYTGEYMPFIDRFMFSLIPGARGVIVNMLRAYNIDGNDSESLSEAVVNCYRNAPFLLNAFKKNFPGFENSYLCDCEPELLIRETRRIIGKYTLTSEDVMEGRRFCDNIALGGYFIDIHSSTDTHGKWVRIEKGYGIPYRTMIPENISGMIVAGRSISGTREASASYRVMATCMAIGQAAGVAAALCCRDNMDPGDINFCELQDILKSQDAII